MEWDALLTKLMADLKAYLPHLAAALGILVLGLLLAWIARLLVSWVFRRVEPQAGRFASRMTFIGVLFGAGLVALGAVGVHVAALATLMGALGLAISLSLQDVAKNVVAGLYLLLERPFESGDQLTVQSFSGQVEAIDLRTTTLTAEDGRQVIVPNTVVLSQIVLRQSSEQPQAELERGDR
jgi:small conductance mechanosensitive channel